ncbi:MAG: urate hydroxylase PuuD [Acidimicrobiales bacterium]
MKIFEDFFDASGGFQFMLRYAHVLVGVTWIGLLYFFNFVQVPSFAEMEPGARSEALRKITFRALWWFRYAALLTFLFGIAMLGIYSSADLPTKYLETTAGGSILTGMLFGITMFLNVWGVIWVNQKIIIASAERVSQGGEADPAVAGAAKKAGRASRANTFFSIPMLWYMVFTTHYSGVFTNDNGGLNNFALYFILVLVTWAIIQASALGFIGGLDNPINKLLFDDHKKTIIFGFVYLALIHFVGWELIMKP